MTDPKQMSDEELAHWHEDEAAALRRIVADHPASPIAADMMRGADVHAETARRLRSGVAWRVPEGWRLDSIDNDGWDHNGPYTLTLARGKGCGLVNIRRGHGPTPEAAMNGGEPK